MPGSARPAAVRDVTLRDRFRADHDDLGDLLKGVLDAIEVRDADGVRHVWTEFDERLHTHLDAEERLMIPPLFASRPREARALLAEHRHVRSRVVALRARLDLQTITAEIVRGFLEELGAHGRHEDAVLYGWADDQLPEGAQSSAAASLPASLRSKVRLTPQ